MFDSLCFVHIPQVKRDKLDKKAIPGIFVGYNLVSKAYKVYHPQTKKISITRDVHFNEDEQWDWKNLQLSTPSADQIDPQWQNELEDDPPISGTRLLSDIYQRCNIAFYKPTRYEEALKDSKWKKAMEEELSMIQKNNTWILVDRPEGKSYWSEVDIQNEAECRQLHQQTQGRASC